MINEEDHIRIQCLFPGLQLKEALNVQILLTIGWKKKSIMLLMKDIGYLTIVRRMLGLVYVPQ